MTEIPHSFYYFVGVLVVTHLGTLGTLFRGVWWIAKADARLEKVEKDLNNLYELRRQQQRS